MIEDVFNSITKELYDEFGENYTYYVEKIPQKVKTPCFTITPIDYRIRSNSPTRYDVTLLLVIHFFPEQNSNTKLNKYIIGERIFDALEYIDVKGILLRTEDINYEETDGVLQSFIKYTFESSKKELNEDIQNYEFMQKLKITQIGE